MRHSATGLPVYPLALTDVSLKIAELQVLIAFGIAVAGAAAGYNAQIRFTSVIRISITVAPSTGAGR